MSRSEHDRDDLVFVGLDFVDRGIKSRRLTAASRPRDQHHAVWLFDVAPEAPQVIVVEPNDVQSERAKLLAHRLFIEHAKHGVFAVNRRHDRYAEVDGAPVVLHAEASVLRHAALGDVQFAHDLDTRNHGRVMFFADRRHGLREHAVYAELDHDGIVARLNVNVGSAPLQSGENRGVDQADDRAGVTRGRKLVDAQRLFRTRVLIFADNLEAFAGLLEHALRLLGLLQDVGDLLERRNLGDDALLQQQADFVDHHQLAGIGNGDRQPPVLRFVERDKVIPEHQVDRNLLEQVMVELEVAQVDEFATVAARDIPRAFQFVGSRHRFRHQFPAIPAHQHCFLIRHAHSSLQPCPVPRCFNAHRLPK